MLIALFLIVLLTFAIMHAITRRAVYQRPSGIGGGASGTGNENIIWINQRRNSF